MGDASRTEPPVTPAVLDRRDVPMLAGFALFQAWVTLCFFTPQLFPDAVGGNNVYMISLAVSVVALALGAWHHHVAAALLQRPAVRWTLAICAAIGTALVPLCFGDSPTQMALTMLAALLTGLAVGFFNVAWCQAFVHRGNAVDFALSVVTSSIVIYVLTNLAYTPAVSPLVMLAISVATPLASALLLNLNNAADHGGEQITVPVNARPQHSYLLRLCVGIFAISLADEFMRNYYLEGTDLSFYSSQINLLILIFKIAVSAMTVTAIRRMQYEEFSFLYRASFMLALIAALLLPFADSAGPVGYALANCGAFVFKLTVFLVCLEYCARGASAALTFCIVRGVWSLDLLLGSGLYAINDQLTGVGIDPGILTIVLVVAVAGAYMFVFASGTNGSLDLLKPQASPMAKKPTDPATATATRRDTESVCAGLAARANLSPREADVLRLLARGRTTARIQDELGISTNTVNTHVRHVFQKLDVHSRQELLDVVEKERG